MTNEVWLALFALITTVIGVASPIIVTRMTNSANSKAKAAEVEAAREDKRIDRAREDEVAARLLAAAGRSEAVAKAAVDQAKEAARLLAANNEVVAATAAETQGQLKQIHTLVNSKLTDANKNVLKATKAALALMLENIELRKTLRADPTPELLGQVSAMRSAITEMEADLADRATQTEIADAQIAQVAPPGAAAAAATKPVPVTDERVAAASERVAKATEESAAAAMRVADATERKP